MNAISEKQIHDFISQLQDDLSTAHKFLQMWRRRTNTTMPVGEGQPELLSSLQTGTSSIADQIRAAIEKCPQQYSVVDVESALIADGITMKRTKISQTLSRFMEAGKIKVHEKGVGRKATIYKK